ncbi:MAG: molybdopterin-dependent oxidoreductase [Chloroflexi bacterium]|nr:molybdopterin-dependent oxidoreductase [Chloroflexota bacterium]MBT7081318.1 molybdopterin-dependent oxidoreductase [Chloroflexota bacterium]MBT7289032.1 molybdopterin-dependent oxidoreductase [Chloroflexota bacterium]
MTVEVKKVVCEYCKGACRVLAYVKNGHLIKATEDPDDPRKDMLFPTAGGCEKLRAAVEVMYHPNRVNFPLKRVGERGEGKWETISWEQALDEIAAKLQKIVDEHGAEAIAGVKGTMRTRNFMPRFFNLLGSPNCTTQGKICSGPIGVLAAALNGWYPNRSTYGGVIPECILLSGTDPGQSWPRQAYVMRECKKKGGKLIVIDPRETAAAKLADLWLQPRPGTDAALFLAIINVIIEDETYDKEFVSKWVHGFDELKERAKEYTPEKVSEITWVPADKIRAAAKILGDNKPHYSWNGMGSEQLTDSIHVLQARFILATITGSLDVPGGVHVGGPGLVRGIPEISAMDKLSDAQKAKQMGADKFKFQSWPGYKIILENSMKFWNHLPSSEQTLAASPHQPSLYRAMIDGKPYPIKGVITLAHNPMVTQANTKLVYKALKSVDIHVVLDYWMTPSAELADYVLPAASGWERPFFMFSYAGDQAVPEKIEGEYDHKIDYDIFRELGIRMGQDWPQETLEEMYDWQLEPIGMTFKQLMNQNGYMKGERKFETYKEKGGFGTTTGKAEVYSTVLDKLGYDPLPKFDEPHETPVSQPELAKDYPLILITGGRFRPMFHSEWRQVDSVRQKRPHPTMQLHPDTAKKMGINDGDWAWIETPRGRIRQQCQHFKGIDPRVCHVEHGWWFPELPGEDPWLHGVWESNANVLTDDDPEICGEVHGGWPLRTALCKVYKARPYLI